MAASFFTLYAVGIYFSNPISAAAAQAAGPLVAAITVRLMTGQPFDPGFGAALGLTILGGLILVAGSFTDTARITLGGGEIIVLLSNALWTVYALKSQAWFDRASQLHRTYVGLLSSFGWLGTAGDRNGDFGRRPAALRRIGRRRLGPSSSRSPCWRAGSAITAGTSAPVASAWRSRRCGST